jgi:iron complex outermembrane receptor protein
MNLGLLSKAKAYRHYYLGYTTEFKPDINNEFIKAAELGYNYASSRFSVNLNAYYTVWENKPLRTIYSTYTLREGDPGYVEGDPDQNAERRVFADITNMNARHIGVEMDFIYKILHNLELQGTVSLGDWIYDSYIEGLGPVSGINLSRVFT